MTTGEGNKIISQFLGGALRPGGDTSPTEVQFKEKLFKRYFWSFVDMEFHSNWQWQIPVYSKLAKEMKEIEIKVKYLPPINLQYAQLLLEYQVALLENSPQKGFEIIIENLKWLNENKK